MGDINLLCMWPPSLLIKPLCLLLQIFYLSFFMQTPTSKVSYSHNWMNLVSEHYIADNLVFSG